MPEILGWQVFWSKHSLPQGRRLMCPVVGVLQGRPARWAFPVWEIYEAGGIFPNWKCRLTAVK